MIDRTELRRCMTNFPYFCNNHVQIYDSVDGGWIPFRLWPCHIALTSIAESDHKFFLALKARQLGVSWWKWAHCLWKGLFRPVQTCLIFSAGEREAKEAVGQRIMGMWERLPPEIQGAPLAKKGVQEIQLANGSRFIAFPRNAGVSYTATEAIVDEADKGETDDLAIVLKNVEPTIEAGGQLWLISTTEKSRPESTFKKICRAAMAKKNSYVPIFIPWQERPGRTQEWYDAKYAAEAATNGPEAAADYMAQEYPSTAAEALAATEKGRRIPSLWLNPCFKPMAQPDLKWTPAIPGLQIFALPARDAKRAPVRYVISGDPAEGNPNSDDSAAHVLRVDTGEEVAMFAGKLEPAVFAEYIAKLGDWYNSADIMVERNNHGHAVLLWLREHSGLIILDGHDDKPGWLTSEKGKSLLYATACDMFKNRELTVHSRRTFEQLSTIEGDTQRAPEGLHDDLAMSFVLGAQAVMILVKRGVPGTCSIPQESIIAKAPAGVFQTDKFHESAESYYERVQRLKR